MTLFSYKDVTFEEHSFPFKTFVSKTSSDTTPSKRMVHQQLNSRYPLTSNLMYDTCTHFSPMSDNPCSHFNSNDSSLNENIYSNIINTKIQPNPSQPNHTSFFNY